MYKIKIKPNSPEAIYMLDWLGNHPLNNDLLDPITALNEGEVWQYKGSYLHENKVVHEFKHLNHPKIHGETVLVVRASDNINEDCIEAK
jgi:hypothetical protein